MSLQKEDQQWRKEKIAPRQASQPEMVWLSSSPGLLPTQLWGALVSALVQWGREAGIEVVSPQRAVEMTHPGDRRHVCVSHLIWPWAVRGDIHRWQKCSGVLLSAALVALHSPRFLGDSGRMVSPSPLQCMCCRCMALRPMRWKRRNRSKAWSRQLQPSEES